MNTLTAKIGRCTLTFEQEYTDSCEEGFTPENELVAGFGVFTIPKGHIKGLKKWFGLGWRKHMEIEDPEWNEKSDFQSHNPNTFIYWMNYVIHNLEEYTVQIKCENIFWPVHDCYHALHDFDFNHFFCSPDGEIVRFRQAYETLTNNGHKPHPVFIQQIVDTFNRQRFGCDGSYSHPRRLVTPEDVTEYEDINQVEIYQ